MSEILTSRQQFFPIRQPRDVRAVNTFPIHISVHQRVTDPQVFFIRVVFEHLGKTDKNEK